MQSAGLARFSLSLPSLKFLIHLPLDFERAQVIDVISPNSRICNATMSSSLAPECHEVKEYAVDLLAPAKHLKKVTDVMTLVS